MLIRLNGRTSGTRKGGSKKLLELANLVFDWQITPDRIEICQRADGSFHQLGRGGYGSVYKARLDKIQDVAVKVLNSQAADRDSNSMTKFVSEIEILKACRHANIVQFVGAFASEVIPIMTHICHL